MELQKKNKKEKQLKEAKESQKGTDRPVVGLSLTAFPLEMVTDHGLEGDVRVLKSENLPHSLSHIGLYWP